MFIEAFGRIITNTEKVSINLPMVTSTKATFMKDPGMGKDDTFGTIKAVTKGIGNSIKCTATENISLLKGLLKVGSKTISLLVDLKNLVFSDILYSNLFMLFLFRLK
jgi:hypothetical protein